MEVGVERDLVGTEEVTVVMEEVTVVMGAADGGVRVGMAVVSAGGGS